MSRHRGGSTPDDALRALAHRDRRRLLIAFLEQSHEEEISAPEEVHVGERDVEKLHVGLHHKHLPRLDALGFVDWDREAGTVSKGPNFSEIQPMLELLNRYRNELPESSV